MNYAGYVRVAVVILSLVSPVSAATIWDVDYFLRGDISQETRFFDDGAYAFLFAPSHISVYILDGDWTFLGHYGAVPLPSDMPAIVFPIGTNAASAVRVSVPEPETVTLLTMALAILFVAWRYRWWPSSLKAQR